MDNLEWKKLQVCQFCSFWGHLKLRGKLRSPKVPPRKSLKTLGDGVGDILFHSQ